MITITLGTIDELTLHMEKKNTIWCVTCLILIIGNYDIIYINIGLVVHVERGLKKKWIECIYFIQIVHLICEYVTWC